MIDFQLTVIAPSLVIYKNLSGTHPLTNERQHPVVPLIFNMTFYNFS